jgi:hypothetical protein
MYSRYVYASSTILYSTPYVPAYILFEQPRYRIACAHKIQETSTEDLVAPVSGYIMHTAAGVRGACKRPHMMVTVRMIPRTRN